MKKYEKIFSPIVVKNLKIKNRVIMLPMGTNFAGPNGEILEEHIKYYEQRAKGGTGAIIVENACVSFPVGSNGTTQLRITEDRFIPGLYNLTSRLHKHGAKAILQINHAGASAVPGRIGCQPISSSDVPSKTGGAIPRSMTKEEIEETAQMYAQAARRAQVAGFDAVEIHAGHSYLISQFLSPIYNKRTDEFGGSFENRARFCKMIIEKIRKEVGEFFPIFLRISADELLEGGNTLEDSLQILEYLDFGVDVYNVSAALNDSIQYQIDAIHLKAAWRVYMAEAVKNRFKKPVITMGNIRDPKDAEDILASGKADFIGIGRGLIAEPNWCEKSSSGREDEIRKCISCNIGCAGHRIGLNRPIECTVNPDLILEDEYKKEKIDKNINVVVVGGGTAGLEAACSLAEVGCTTFLLEKEKELGGLAKEIAKFPAKQKISFFPEYLEKRAESLKNLITLTGVTATVDLIKNFKPDLVINATGSKPLLPPIKGLKDLIDKEETNVYSIFGTMKNIDKFDFEGKEVVVIGGGAVGLDVVEFATEKGAKVTIVERMHEIGKDLDFITRIDMLGLLNKKAVKKYTSTSLTEVKNDRFIVETSDKEIKELKFDYGFVCLGMQSNSAMLQELEENFESKGVKVLNIGDSVRPRKILEGVSEGRDLVDFIKNIK
ncbi:oxidoreductase [Cetobacterium sp.]|uniref:oxidoreductase n=1 Tax=Cetobacterium sp. TaxID=2071632 RepID=UPI003F3D6F52